MHGVIEDFDQCYRAVRSKDARFDGWFFTAVTSTGIYCRPSCPAMTPKRANMRFLPSAAAAQRAGFRACKRCRPDATPGSPEWNLRADLVARAMRLIADGVVDREGVPGLARRLGYSERQLHRQLVAELGAGPLALARAQRAQTARLLIETTTLPMADVAFAAGFASIRQFNDTVREVFALTPTELRRARGRARDGRARRRARDRRESLGRPSGAHAAPAPPGAARRRRPVRRSSPRARCRASRSGTGARHLPAHARAAARPRHRALAPRPTRRPRRTASCASTTCATSPPPCSAAGGCSTSTPTRSPSTTRSRADPLLAPLVRRAPGPARPGRGRRRRARGARGARPAGVGRRRAHARRPAGRRARRAGARRRRRDDALTHVFPTAAALAAADPAELPLTRARAHALVTLCGARSPTARSRSTPAPTATRRASACSRCPGIGPWTAEYVAMRALGDPDAFLPTDLGVRKALERLGLPTTAALIARRRALAALARLRRPAPVGTRLDPQGENLSRCTPQRSDTPAGPFTIVASDEARARERLDRRPRAPARDDRPRAAARRRADAPSATSARSPAPSQEYHAGDLTAIDAIPVSVASTPFHERAWARAAPDPGRASRRRTASSRRAAGARPPCAPPAPPAAATPPRCSSPATASSAPAAASAASARGCPSSAGCSTTSRASRRSLEPAPTILA